MIRARYAPPNSIVAISDPSGGEIPIPPESSRIAATSSFLVVGCLSFMDGETEFTLGNREEVDPGKPTAFDGTLETPSRAIQVATVFDEVLLRADVPSDRTRVRVWTNDPKWPDRVIIGLGD